MWRRWRGAVIALFEADVEVYSLGLGDLEEEEA